MTERLVAQVKRKLNITWNDDDTTNRVQDIIQSAIPALKHKLGIADPDFDFGIPGMENDLFKAYCLYEFNHCLNEFDANYANDILQVRAKYEVKDYLANEVADGE
jgi:hypothetical protein